MSNKLQTPEEIDKWVAENADVAVEITHSVMQEIIENVVPEMCGYAIAKFGAHQGH